MKLGKKLIKILQKPKVQEILTQNKKKKESEK